MLKEDTFKFLEELKKTITVNGLQKIKPGMNDLATM